MAHMIPNYNEEQLKNIESQGEIKVYRALKDGLNDDYYIFSQVAWILKNEGEEAKDGETDFVICHPKHGILCIEVKGGGISFDSSTNKWYSENRYNEKKEIHNPIAQGRKAKFSILKKLKENVQWNMLGIQKIGCGHAVFFPDISDATPLVRPDLPLELIGIYKDLSTVEKWVKGCFKYWDNKDHPMDVLGSTGINVFEKVFASSISVKVLLSTSLENEELIRIDLTNEQIKVLDMLKRKRRAVVSGGAGTGKTVLAINKAKRLAKDGFKTLLTCYNRPLADYLSLACKEIPNLEVMSFHQLCYSRIKMAYEKTDRNLLQEAKMSYPDQINNEFNFLLPTALLDSIDLLKLYYDAIVCDEGQDFCEEYWLPLMCLLSNDDSSPLYIFYDDNQNLYSRVGSFPIQDDDIYPLKRNCRNTVQIHKASYKYYKGEEIECSGMVGEEIKIKIDNTIEKQAKKIQMEILDLIIKEKVAPNKITILIADAIRKKEYIDSLEVLSLPKGIEYEHEENRKNIGPLVTTVNKFKGLESDIIFLWGIDNLVFEEFQKYMYVGLSRAKSIAIIVCNNDTVECIKKM